MSTNSLSKNDPPESDIDTKPQISALYQSIASILLPKKVTNNNFINNEDSTENSDIQKTVKKGTILNNKNQSSNTKTVKTSLSPVKRTLFEMTAKKFIQDVGMKNIINPENYLAYLIKYSKIPHYLRDYQALDALEVATKYIKCFE